LILCAIKNIIFQKDDGKPRIFHIHFPFIESTPSSMNHLRLQR
jgi:hypothetical protein